MGYLWKVGILLVLGGDVEGGGDVLYMVPEPGSVGLLVF